VNTCLWNEILANNGDPAPCRPSYMLGNPDCSSNFNIVTGYKATGGGNPQQALGVLALGGAWVNLQNISWIHGGNLFEGTDYEWLGAGSGASDGPSGNEQTCTAAVDKCPIPPPVP